MQRAWVASPDYRSVIAALRLTRSSAGISQRELARRLGKPPSFINKIELLERRLDVLELVAIAHGLELKPAELIQKITGHLPADLKL
jgi:transcriptional regulator with XRE-family HTH domain